MSRFNRKTREAPKPFLDPEQSVFACSCDPDSIWPCDVCAAQAESLAINLEAQRVNWEDL